MSTKRVLAIHDLCSFGRCSLTAAIPVISAMGIQVCPFPTALFSNNLTYGTFTCTDCTPDMPQFMAQWQKLGYTYDAVYSGFLGNAEQISLVMEAINRFHRTDTVIIVDPAMADDGKLYPVFTGKIVTSMRTLVQKADVITPNYTEATMLLNEPYTRQAPTTKKIQRLCKDLTTLGPSQIIITSVPCDHDKLKVVCYNARTMIYDEYVIPRIPFATCGTGDIFTSVVTGALLQNKSLSATIRWAADFVSYAINYTYKAGTDSREGVQLEPCLSYLRGLQQQK